MATLNVGSLRTETPAAATYLVHGIRGWPPIMRIENRFLLNFSASYSGGGYKRLYAFADWFDRNGGAWLAIHPRCGHLVDEFPRNEYFIITQSRLARLHDDWSYLARICKSIGRPDLYYAYGIPLYRRLGRVNWSHLQNVLLVGRHNVPLSIFNRLKFRLLADRMRRGFANADVISAESHYSLGLLEAEGWRNPFLSINGSDDELGSLREQPPVHRENIAVVVGTISYKSVDDAFCTFRMLQQSNPELKLVIVGDTRWVPRQMRERPDVMLRGMIDRHDVIECLRRAQFFICATQVENSFNCAAEGAFLAAESYLSEIPPHSELLAGEAHDRVSIPGLDRPMLYVRKERLRGIHLQSWDRVIGEMVARVEQVLCEQEGVSTVSRSDAALMIPKGLIGT